jgi:hypothetical protein
MKRAPSVSIKSIASRTFFVMVAAVALALGDGCNQGKEGDRCNPDLAPGESDCNSGLTCQKSPTCAETGFCR